MSAHRACITSRWLTPTHTLIHLDGIALGSLLALGLYTLHLSRRVWLWLGLSGFVLGIIAAATIAGGTAFLDSALALAFAGAVLAAIASHRGPRRQVFVLVTGARNPLNAVLRRGPLAFYGRISYGLYMIHIMVFIYFGWFDLKMDPYGTRATWRSSLSGSRSRPLRDRALVRLRIADSEIQALLLRIRPTRLPSLWLFQHSLWR